VIGTEKKIQRINHETERQEGVLHFLVAAVAIASEHATDGSAESDDEGDERTEDHPVCVSVAGGIPLRAETVACDAEQDHVDHPNDESDDRRERGRQCHDDRAHASERGAA